MKKILQSLLPFGIVEWHRRRFMLNRLGLPKRGGARTLEAAKDVRYEFWPLSVRQNKQPLMIDVGANRGDFTASILRIKPEAKVVAVEPEPNCAALFRKRYSGDPRVSLIEAALGDEEGAISLNVCRDDRLGSLLSPCDSVKQSYPEGVFDIIEVRKVQMTLLDSIVPPNIRVAMLKLDVQGYEEKVLKGGSAVLQRCDSVMFEFNYQEHYEGQADWSSLHQLLTKHSFKLHGVSAPFFAEGKPMWADVFYARE